MEVWLLGFFFPAPNFSLVKRNRPEGCRLSCRIQNQLWDQALGEIERVAATKIQSERGLRDRGWIREDIWVQGGRIDTNSYIKEENLAFGRDI